MNINGINNVLNSNLNLEKANGKNKETGFQDFLSESLKNVNDLQLEAEKKNLLLATGKIENIHDVTIASEKAKVALDLTLAVRNKVVDTYREMMRMQV
jgi:flagellar hook-basal body complex protein FliE